MTASTFIANGSLWLYVNNQIILQGSDSVTIELRDGEEYIVHWFVMATPGTSYSITISSPREAQYQLTKVVGRTGKDLNSFRFTT
jgi:hypothetical protein